jgi:predicted transposase YbfD/YdcC
MAKYIPVAFEINLRPEGVVFEVGSLFEALATLHDQRDARGVRYALVTVLVLIVLAKLAGENHVRGMAQWVRRRAGLLAGALALAQPQAPHATTYSRVLGRALVIEEFERVSREFFAGQPQAGTSVVISIDGKTMRGTIPAGQSRGVHLLAAFLPDEGWVMVQVEVGSQGNEIPATGRVLQVLDLRGKIVTGDALLAQRTLSLQIIQAGGDYVWIIEDNQAETRQDLEVLFGVEQCSPGHSPAAQADFRTAQTVDKAHGRIEQRTITVSSALNDYLDWPGVKQVFRLERRFTRVRDGKGMHQVVYGLTSLSAREADPERLLTLIRQHWQIENGLHYRRDGALQEDRCTLRTGHAAQAMALINNLVLGLLLRHGIRNVPDARRDFAADPHQAVNLILGRP